jgi:hypothetical protein
MFSFFKSPPYSDNILGEFTRSRGHWRGAIALEGATSTPLVLSGTRTEPDPKALATAHALPNAFTAWRQSIESALYEHYRPYAEALAAAEISPPSNPPPKIESPSGIWPHVSLVYVSVTPLDGTLTSEFGYTTSWDEEHTLGARFRDGKLLELCGSVLQP